MPVFPDNSAQSSLWNITAVFREAVDPNNEWVNTFTVSHSQTDIQASTATAWAGALVAPLRASLPNRVLLDRIRISTYARGDTSPYDANEFVTVPVNQLGLRVVATSIYPPAIAVAVRRNVAAGRNGFFLLRGAILPTDTTESLSGITLTAAARTLVQNWMDSLYTTLSSLDPNTLYVVPSVNKFQSNLVLPNARVVLNHRVLDVSVTRHRRGRRR